MSEFALSSEDSKTSLHPDNVTPETPDLFSSKSSYYYSTSFPIQNIRSWFHGKPSIHKFGLHANTIKLLLMAHG